MCSSAITWRLLTPSTSTLRRISIQRSILVNTPSSRYKSSELRNKLSGMGWGVSHFSTGFLESQTAALFDRRLHKTKSAVQKILCTNGHYKLVGGEIRLGAA